MSLASLLVSFMRWLLLEKSSILILKCFRGG